MSDNASFSSNTTRPCFSRSQVRTSRNEESEKSTVTLAANLVGMKAAGSIVFGSSAIVGSLGVPLAGSG